MTIPATFIYEVQSADAPSVDGAIAELSQDADGNITAEIRIPSTVSDPG